MRQDTLTQLKAYFMALGGTLETLKGSESVFDKVIYENFIVHLQLTLLTNPDLEIKYPYYAALVGKREVEKYSN